MVCRLTGKKINISYKKITNEITDQRLQDRSIQRLDNIINTSIPINFQCKKCEHIWKTTPSSIFSGTGCPSCVHNNRKITDKIVDNKLVGKEIIRLDPVNGCSIPIRWKCQKNNCGHVWR